MKPTTALMTTLICVMMIQTSNAQCVALKGKCKKSDFWEVQAGAGLLPTFLKDHTQTLMAPVLLGLSYRIKPNMSLGLLAGTSVSQAPRTIPGELTPSMHRNHYTTVSLRAAAHTTTLGRWEIYGGMLVGYGASRVEVRPIGEEKTPEPVETYNKGKVYLSAFLGSRYALNKKIGVFSELGMGISILSGGVSWKF